MSSRAAGGSRPPVALHRTRGVPVMTTALRARRRPRPRSARSAKVGREASASANRNEARARRVRACGRKARLQHVGMTPSRCKCGKFEVFAEREIG